MILEVITEDKSSYVQLVLLFHSRTFFMYESYHKQKNKCTGSYLSGNYPRLKKSEVFQLQSKHV